MTESKPPGKKSAARGTPTRPRKTAPPAEPPAATVTALPTSDQPSLERILEDNLTLYAVLGEAVAQMTWLKPTDAAMVKLCQRYALAIDDAVSIAAELEEMTPHLQALAGEGVDIASLYKRIAAIEKAVDLVKVVGWVGPQLANALRDIGGTPAERKGLEADAPVKSRLAQLREQSKSKKPPAAGE